MSQEVNNIKEITKEIQLLIEQSKQQIAYSVNATMSLLYWQIGNKINQEVLQNNRGEYGKQIIVSLSRKLVNEYGRSFSEKNLKRMIQFATHFSDEKIVVSMI